MKKIHLILILFSTVSCTDDTNKSSCESSLPPATTTGANTFGACINGNLLIPRSGTGSIITGAQPYTLWGGLPNSTDYYELIVRDLKSTRTASIVLHMQAVDANGLGNYVINESNGQRSIDGPNHTYLYCRVYDEKTNQYAFYRSYENSGILEITTYNLNNRLLSGNFNCWVKNSANANDSIQIKQGRFDINWASLPNISFP